MKHYWLLSMLLFLAVGEVMNATSHDVYFVILAGGNGERLWPLSRRCKPKQLLSVTNKKTLLEQAIERIAPLTKKENIWVCTTAWHEPNIRKCIGDQVGRIIIEPSSRNTAPAIIFSCFKLMAENPGARVIFLPADPFIPEKDYAKFADFIEHGIDFITHTDELLLFGVRPTYPATGYGYIEYDDTSREFAPYKVKQFKEKPVLERAQHYIDVGNMLWNICMFGGKVAVFIDEFKRWAPELYGGMKQYLEGTGLYESVPSDSIDYAVLEKSERVSVLPVDFSWCDVGNIQVFLSLQEQAMKKEDNVLLINSSNNMISVNDKLVALVGVDDLCIVQTEDALLITKRDEAEKIKQIVTMLKAGSFDEYL